MLDGPPDGSGFRADGYTPDVSGPLTGVDPGNLAVVLVGGGTVGIAWELGVLIGLECQGVSLRGPSRIIGSRRVADAVQTLFNRPALGATPAGPSR